MLFQKTKKKPKYTTSTTTFIMTTTPDQDSNDIYNKMSWSNRFSQSERQVKRLKIQLVCAYVVLGIWMALSSVMAFMLGRR